ncbi:hypothetical protein MRB53_016196 [Persea americana]|uniref:Uncharacterized protein n=1 Tax=Persea americana TaxID=3435 RepID=A0ACC2M1E9_PERAE|nr:hypothetical protein MRB53_016196 [Persea americana]
MLPPPLATIDPTSNKLKTDENGIAAFKPTSQLTPNDASKILEPFTTEQLLEILQDASVRHLDVLDIVYNIADRDLVQHKLFIRGLCWETTTDTHCTSFVRGSDLGLLLFSSYCDLDEGVVILDKATEKSKGYSFVTFKREK